MSDNKNTSKNEPKPVALTDTPKVEDTRPSYIKDAPELPPGAAVFVLVPVDELERRATVDQLDDALFKYFENAPKETTQLKAARVPYGSQLYVAHCTTERGKRPDGTFGPIKRVHVGGPVELSKFSVRSADEYTWETDLGAVAGAVTAACKHTNGTVWLAKLSGDAQADQKVVKLFKE